MDGANKPDALSWIKKLLKLCGTGKPAPAGPPQLEPAPQALPPIVTQALHELKKQGVTITGMSHVYINAQTGQVLVTPIGTCNCRMCRLRPKPN